MKIFNKLSQYKGLTFVFAFTVLKLNAQQVVTPSDNKPLSPAPQTYSAVPYPGLFDLIYNSNTKFNYVRTTRPNIPLTSIPTGTYANSSNTDFFDGLGRPLQTVVFKGHAAGNDIVMAHVYDELGRETYQYLPFAAPTSLISSLAPVGNLKLNVNTQLRGFYDANGPDEQPYGQTIFDGSPLNRVVKQMGPGRSWVGSNRGVNISYRGNVANEVRKWTIGSSMNAIPVTSLYYNANELFVTTVTDEDGKISIKYKDKFGNIIFEKKQLVDNSQVNGHSGFACIYYVYDDLNRLRFVIPPEAINQIQTTWTLGTIVNNGLDLCFSYNYDELGHLVQKKIPGKDVEFFVYDKRNRLIMFQDGNLRSHYPDGLARWQLSFYDGLNRPTMSAICIANEDRTAMVTLINDNSVYTAPHWLYYLKNYNLFHTYPTTIANCTILGYNYYDDYSNVDPALGLNFDPSQFNSITYPTNGILSPSNLSSLTRGLLTGSKERVLDPDNTNERWLNTVLFYDDKQRVIQTQSQNINNGVDINSNVYYFQGPLYKNILQHNNPYAKAVPGAGDGPFPTIHVTSTINRNLSGAGGSDQILSITRKIENGIEYPFANYSYDHLGRIVVKQLPAANFLQEFNMHGFLNHIDVENNNNQSSTTDPDPQFFEEHISYDTGFASKLYNGNIAGITWKMKGTTAPLQAYGYSYDNLNRLTYAEYVRKENGQSTWGNSLYNYTAADISYDLNGNIKTMKQWGPNATLNGSPIVMDQLVYSYAPGTNKLIKVEDAPDQNPSLPDFKNNANIPTEYGYDNNGNLETDANKAVSVPTKYNFLNKPEKITIQNKGVISYIYGADGKRLSKKIHYTDGSGSPDEKWDYLGNFVYKDSILQYILNEEGRTRPTFSPDDPSHATKYIYDYFVKDHLGNVRSTITAEPINHDYLARHEISQANIEQLVFDNIPNVRGAKPGSTDPNDNMAARLNGNAPNTTVGTAILLQAMPGDEFQISADAFYDGEYQQQSVSKTQDVISSIMGALLGGANYDGVPLSELPTNVRTIQTLLNNPSLTSQLDQIINATNDPSAPKAHLNYLFFDERMNLIGPASGSIQVYGNTGGWTNIHPSTGRTRYTGTGVGYILVYVDNQSIGKDVWFDNISIEHYTGKLLEEDHYYPFGLTLNTLPASNVPNGVKQPYKSQGIPLERHFGLETLETFFRGLDPQLGRFNSIDPKAEKNWQMSPYNAMNNNPVIFTDILGDSVNYSAIYEKNKDGSYVNPQVVLAFELFASSDEGKTYLLDHAQKGFSLKGSMVEGLDIEASEEGSASASGVDVTYELKDVPLNKTVSTVGGNGFRSSGERLKVVTTFQRQFNQSPYFNTSGVEETLFYTNMIFHETFLHATNQEARYMKNYHSAFLLGTDHDDATFNGSYYQLHGVSMLQEAQRKLNISGMSGSMSEANMRLMMDVARGDKVDFKQKYGIVNKEGICEYKCKNE